MTHTYAVLRATQTWNKRLKEIIVSVRGAESMLHATLFLVTPGGAENTRWVHIQKDNRVSEELSPFFLDRERFQTKDSVRLDVEAPKKYPCPAACASQQRQPSLFGMTHLLWSFMLVACKPDQSTCARTRTRAEVSERETPTPCENRQAQRTAGEAEKGEKNKVSREKRNPNGQRNKNTPPCDAKKETEWETQRAMPQTDCAENEQQVFGPNVRKPSACH